MRACAGCGAEDRPLPYGTVDAPLCRKCSGVTTPSDGEEWAERVVVATASRLRRANAWWRRHR